MNQKKNREKIARYTYSEIKKMSAARPFNSAAFDAVTDEDIARQIAEDPDTAPDVTTLPDAWRIKPRTARRKLGNLTQRQAAKLLRIGLGTLRNWEQGRTLPDGPAKTLLIIAEREPKAVLRALKQE